MLINNRKICLNCEHWNGDRKLQRKQFKENPICMDIENGWPLDGYCSEIRYTLDIEVFDGAIGRIYTDSNFGCILFKKYKWDYRKGE